MEVKQWKYNILRSEEYIKTYCCMLIFSIATPDRISWVWVNTHVCIVSRPIILSAWSLSVYFTAGSVTDWCGKAQLLKSLWKALILISSSTPGSSATRDPSRHNEGCWDTREAALLNTSRYSRASLNEITHMLQLHDRNCNLTTKQLFWEIFKAEATAQHTKVCHILSENEQVISW